MYLFWLQNVSVLIAKYIHHLYSLNSPSYTQVWYNTLELSAFLLSIRIKAFFETPWFVHYQTPGIVWYETKVFQSGLTLFYRAVKQHHPEERGSSLLPVRSYFAQISLTKRILEVMRIFAFFATEFKGSDKKPLLCQHLHLSGLLPVQSYFIPISLLNRRPQIYV